MEEESLTLTQETQWDCPGRGHRSRETFHLEQHVYSHTCATGHGVLEKL